MDADLVPSGYESTASDRKQKPLAHRSILNIQWTTSAVLPQEIKGNHQVRQLLPYN